MLACDDGETPVGGGQAEGAGGSGGSLAEGGSGGDAPITPAVGDTQVLVLGDNHTCYSSGAAQLLCWGDNTAGQVGNGESEDAAIPSPISLAKPLEAVGSLAAGTRHTCALLSLKGETNRDLSVEPSEIGIFCWGANERGQVDPTNPSPVVAVPTKVELATGLVPTSLALGDAHSCAAFGEESTYCWGDNTFGQLGSPSVGPLPQAVEFPSRPRLFGGANFICAAETDLKPPIQCWGDDSLGQHGDGVPNDAYGWSTLVDNPLGFRQIAGRGNAAIGTASAAGGDPLVGWGASAVVDPMTATPTILSPDGAIGLLALGDNHACNALSEAVCWGNNDAGQLGDGSTTPASAASPAVVSRPELDNGAFALLSLGAHHSCAGLTDGVLPGNGQPVEARLYCWGGNAHGELGDGSVESRPTMTLVILPE